MDDSQIAVLRSAILAETDPELVEYRTGGATEAIADWYNENKSPVVLAWDGAAPVDRVLDQIDQSVYTPKDTADGNSIFTNRTLVAQTKLMVLQSFILGQRQTLDGRLSTIRKSLRDAVIKLPTDAGGANQDAAGASGVNAMTALTRSASRAEILFITSTPTTGTVTAALLSWEGFVTGDDVVKALNPGG